MEAEAISLKIKEADFVVTDVDFYACKERSEYLFARRNITSHTEIGWLLKAVSFIDLTTLAGDDTPVNVARLVMKAANPISKELLYALGVEELECAAVCVYPSQVPNVVQVNQTLGKNLLVASVATGFPTGQTYLPLRLDEIRMAVHAGADEVDVVVNRQLILEGKFKEFYDEICLMKKACGDAKLKVIMAVGEIGSFTNIYNACMWAMKAGANFIKTSTGKEVVNATYPIGIVMMRAIRNFYQLTGVKVGFKPAGGIKSSGDILKWCFLVKEELGNDWLRPEMFRIGASSVLSNIEERLYSLVNNTFCSQLEICST